MAKIKSFGMELVSSHSTEEIIEWLSNESRRLVNNVNSQADADAAAVRNWANAQMMFSILWELDSKLNGKKIPAVL